MLATLAFIIITGILAYGILAVIKILEFLVNSITDWIKKKSRNRKLKKFAVELSTAVKTMHDANPDGPVIDISKLGCNEVVVMTDENGNIQDPDEDMIGLDTSELKYTDPNDKWFHSQVKQKGLVELKVGA